MGPERPLLFKMITKVLKPDLGEIHFNGTVITGLPSYKIARLGIGYVFQESLLFESKTLFENMLVCGNTPVNSGLLSMLPFYQRKERRELRERVREVLKLFNLEAKSESLPKTDILW